MVILRSSTVTYVLNIYSFNYYRSLSKVDLADWDLGS